VVSLRETGGTRGLFFDRCLITTSARTKKEEEMDEFKEVSVVKKANVYYEGKVTSRTILFRDGSRKTLGIMLPGEYEFSTGDGELMEIMSGELDLLPPGEKAWKTIRGGDAFEVPPHSKFRLRVKQLADYCCSFLK
jgi:uncharacterized protein YaiE (UPF0345 family)